MTRILRSVQSLSLTPREFQNTQTELNQQNLLNYAPIGCAYEDALAELLAIMRLGVVLDKHTSWSRTTWLSGIISGAPLLIVLDTTKSNDINRASIDLWTNIEGISDHIFEGVQESQMGCVPDTYSSLEISWQIEIPRTSTPQLLVTLSAAENPGSIGNGEIFFAVEYQGSMSETFKTTYPLYQEQVSIAIELGNEKSEWKGSLDEPFLILFFSDSGWKSAERFHQVRFTWRNALIRQIERYLASGKRLQNFLEVSSAVNLDDTDEGKMAKNLFFSFCLDSVVEGCKSQRVSDYCKRCVVLFGLVICFNPKRGLSGYLEMVLEGPGELLQLGSERTWRDHLSSIVNSAQDFKPIQVELVGKKKSRGPGRPPTQLVPTIPPLKMFKDFTNNPETIVCRYCRFSNDSE
jgi:hypothetical protein